MDENKYSELSSYFSLNEWNNISEYEKKRNYNLLENYKVLCSLELTVNRPDFMCGKKRKYEEKGKSTRDKLVKTRPGMKRKKDINIPIKQNAWQHIPSPDELAQDIDEDFLGFSEAESVGQIEGFAVLNRVIKELENELESLEGAENISEKQTDDHTRRYPKRLVARKDYAEGNVPDDDDYIFCDDCDQEWEGDCPVHGPLTIVEDTKVPADPRDPTRADRTVPSPLCVAQSGIYGAGRGVWTSVPLSKGLRFGPYEGAKVESSNSNGYCWQIRRNHRPLHCVDAKDCSVANWMRYVNCARNEEEQNLMAFQYKGKMYYRTFRDIPPHVELLVWYGDEYGRELGIDVENFHKPQEKQSFDAFKCVGCGITYSSPLYLEKHKKYCRTLKCVRFSRNDAECGFKSSGANNIKHNLVYNGQKLDLCNRQDSNFSDIINHVKHAKISDNNMCDRTFSQNSDDTEHKTNDTDVCGNKLTKRSNFPRHVMTLAGDKPCKCKECEHKFTQRFVLSAHRSINAGGNPYACEKCGQKFARKSNLITHTRIHTGEKPYSCEKCGQNFAQKSSLNTHTRIHTGEKHYSCEKCGQKYADSSNFVYHTSIHSGEKPYSCEDTSFPGNLIYISTREFTPERNNIHMRNADIGPMVML